MQNISAVLDQRHSAWVDGYKPLDHFQAALATVVERRLLDDHRLSETLAEYQVNALAAPMPHPLSTDDVLVDAPSVSGRGIRTSIGLTIGPYGAIQDFQNRRLGRAGEAWVVDVEREQLDRAGRRDLADQVVWVANDIGDGAGFDISSFRRDGSPLNIEVKTTNFGARTPFYVTRWEVEVSRHQAATYALYRVFDFRSDPHLYRLEGSVEESARLEPSVFVGVPR